MKIFRSSYPFFKKSQNSDGRHFSSRDSIPPSILDGVFNYYQSFRSFCKDTEQKAETAIILSHFVNKLKKIQVSFLKPQPAKILDIGSNNSKTGIGYLKDINHPFGFDYWGVDTNGTFLKNAATKLSESSIIKNYTLVNADALSGNLKWREEFKFLSFDFIFASHVVYYVRDELSCRAFLADIINLLSPQCGTAIFFHEDSTIDFRVKYNRANFNFPSTPVMLQNSARGLAANVNQFKSIKFTSKLRFAPLSEELWEFAKDPKFYKNCAHIPKFVETLEKLAFIVQRDLIALAKEGSLSRYVDEVREVITENDYCLDLDTHMQTMVAPQCTLHNKIAKALTETQKEIPSIMSKITNGKAKKEMLSVISQDQEQCSSSLLRF